MENLFEKELPVYVVPTMKTYTDEGILEELGPAQAIYGSEPSLNP